MHILAFLDPGHFHAALTLRERQPRVRDEIYVYAPAGPELDDFLALIEAFNRRRDRPTAWRPVVRRGDGSLERLVADRPGDIVVLAGRNDRKMTLMRRLHDAGFHVLADKPWLAGPDGLDDLRHTLAGGPLAMEIMTGRYDLASILVRKLVGDRGAFGELERGDEHTPAVEIAGVHHLEKIVNGAALRRPPWYFDVRAQGDGIADIPTHMVDQAQRLVASASVAGAPPGSTGTALELIAARRSATRVPRALFARVTGDADFPPELHDRVENSELSYEGNAALSFRVGGVVVALETRWDLSAPAGGGDANRTIVRGTRAEVRLERSAATNFERRLLVLPRPGVHGLAASLERTVAGWQGAHPGVALAVADGGWEIRVPPNLGTGHESHFPLVLSDFLTAVEQGNVSPHLTAQTLAKYQLLVDASRVANTRVRL